MYDVILSGPISGDGKYRERFALAKVRARQKRPGATVWNPAELPAGMAYKWYMRQCIRAIMDEAAPGCVLVLLKRWNRSFGAVAEWALARCLGMRVERE